MIVEVLEILEILGLGLQHVSLMGISALIGAAAAAASTAVVGWSAGTAGVAALAGVSALLSFTSSAVLAARKDSFRDRSARAIQGATRNRSSGLKKNIQSASTPRRLIYGTSRVGGPILFAENTGNANQYLHLVIAHASHKCKSIESIYLDEKKLSLDSDGFDTATQFGDKVRVNKHLGSETQAADADLKSEVSKWDSDNRLRGICYTYTRLEWDNEVFGGAGLPKITAVVNGKDDVFDPRDNTKKYTENPALCIYDYLTHSKLGIGASADEINSESVKVAANECDEEVTNNNGSTEKRYTLNGAINTDEVYGDVIENMTTSMAGQVVYSKGKFHIQAGASSIEGTEYDESDLISSLTVQTQLPTDQVFNSVRSSFVSENDRYTSKDMEPLQPEKYVKEDREEKWKEISLPFTNSHTMARRISRIRLRKVRNPVTIEGDFMLKAYQNRVGDIVKIKNSRMGWDKKKFEIVSWDLKSRSSQEGGFIFVNMKLQERPDSVYQNQQEPLDSITGSASLRDPNDVSAPSGFTVTNNPLTLSDGSSKPRFTLSWDSPPEYFVQNGGLVEIEKKLSSDSTWKENVAVLDADTTTKSIGEGIVTGNNYDFRIRFSNIEGGYSAWTENTSNTSTSDEEKPLEISSVSTFQEGEFVELTYDGVSDDDRKHYDIWIDDDASFDEGTATKLDEHDSTMFKIAVGRLFALGFGGDVTFGVKAVDRAGNKSSSWTTSTINLSDGYGVEQVTASSEISPGAIEEFSLSNNYIVGTADLVVSRPEAADSDRDSIHVEEYVTNNANEITDIKVHNPYDEQYDTGNTEPAHIGLYMFGIEA